MQTLRPFLASCQSYLAFLGSPPSMRMLHVGTFISLSSELAVAASPLQYRLSKGQLYQRMTIRDLQVQVRSAPSVFHCFKHLMILLNTEKVHNQG